MKKNLPEGGLNENPFNDFEFETQIGDVAEELIPTGIKSSATSPPGNPGPQLGSDNSNYIALPAQFTEDQVLTL